MYRRTIVFENENGVNGNLLIDFMKITEKFESRIQIGRADDKKHVNAKSIIAIAELELIPGEEVEISAVGEDEIEAVDTLISLMEPKYLKTSK